MTTQTGKDSMVDWVIGRECKRGHAAAARARDLLPDRRVSETGSSGDQIVEKDDGEHQEKTALHVTLSFPALAHLKPEPTM